MQRLRWLNPSGAVGLLRGRVRDLVLFTAMSKFLEMLLFVPLSAAIMRYCLLRWGRCSVGNFEIAAFLLSVPGLVALITVSTLVLACFFFEIAGLIVLLANHGLGWRDALIALARRILPIAGLALRQLILLLGLAIPFLLACWGMASLLWAGRDINGLLVLKPPVFWGGAAGAGIMIAIYLVLALRLMIRWSLALPALLFEGRSAASAIMKVSAERTRGRLAVMTRDVVVWLVLLTAATALVIGLLALMSGLLLNAVRVSLGLVLTITAALLLVHALIALSLSAVGSAVLGGLVLTWYRHAGGAAEVAGDSAPKPETPSQTPGMLSPLIWVAAALAIVVATMSYFLLNTVRVGDPVELTAHRAGARLGPENSIAALRKAIEAKAEWAEIDVQHSADKALVVTHDSDLMRVGGLNRQVANMTLDEIRKIDIGERVGAEFRGERIPTLEEIIATAGSHISLNIELKPHGRDDVEPLVRDVVEVLQRTGIVQRCRVCSQSYEGIQLARKLAPDLTIGFIAGAAIGDIAKLDVNYLMVNSSMATRRLCDSARTRGTNIHAWTINDADMLAPLLDRGVANVITDDPRLMRARLDEIRQLRPVERLLLRARNSLAD